MKISRKVLFALSILISINLFCACANVDSVTKVSLNKVYGGEVIDVRTKYVKAYLEADTEKEQIYALTDYRVSVGWDASTPITVSWTGNGSKEYAIRIATEEDMSDAVIFTAERSDISYTFENLVPGQTYYYDVCGTSKGDNTPVDSFKILDVPTRWITAGGVSNMRDMGGWKTQDGRQIRYGLLYRGGMLNGYNNGPKITEAGKKVFANSLKMRSEIDLRGDSDNGGQSYCAWGNGQYRRWSLGAYDAICSYSGRYVRTSTETLKNIFAFLANEDNYPVYFHCNWGADRTGTLAYLINGLLGVSYLDLIKDFELTTFSPSGARYRSAIEGNSFTATGIMRNDSGNYVAFGRLHQVICSHYRTDSGLLSDAIERYLTEEVGVTETQIEKLKYIMLK